MVSIFDISFSYGKEIILQNINLSIQKSQFVTIIGPNGAGKSTLLKLIANIYRTNCGKIEINGKNVDEYNKKSLAKIMAYIPQFSTHMLKFSVMEYIMLGRTPFISAFAFETKKDLEILLKMMSLTQTFHLRDRYLDEISGGERKLVETARALAQEPIIILADEPTTYLDLHFQVFISSLFRNLSQENGTTVIAVYHDLNLAARFSDHLILLSKGRILANGNPEHVLKKELLEEAYNCKISVDRDPIENSLRITPY